LGVPIRGICRCDRFVGEGWFAGIDPQPGDCHPDERDSSVYVEIALGLQKHHGLSEISRRSWVFLMLSGIYTGLSWLCYFVHCRWGPHPVLRR
jgi:hypothetical protein